MVKILVIDENASLKEPALEALTKQGHRVTLVSRANDVMEAYSGARWDLILMNPQMEGEERWDIVTLLKQHNPPVPVLITNVFQSLPPNACFETVNAYLRGDANESLLPQPYGGYPLESRL